MTNSLLHTDTEYVTSCTRYKQSCNFRPAIVTISDNQFLGGTLTLQQRIEFQPDQHHVSRALKALGLTDAKGVVLEPTMRAAPTTTEIRAGVILLKKSEGDLVTEEKLKLFQNVAAWFIYLSLEKPDLLYSIQELMRKMASPR